MHSENLRILVQNSNFSKVIFFYLGARVNLSSLSTVQRKYFISNFNLQFSITAFCFCARNYLWFKIICDSFFSLASHPPKKSWQGYFFFLATKTCLHSAPPIPVYTMYLVAGFVIMNMMLTECGTECGTEYVTEYVTEYGRRTVFFCPRFAFPTYTMRPSW